MHPMNGLEKQQPFSAPIFVTLSCSRVASSCLRTNINRSERCEGGMPPGFRGAIRPMQRTLRMCRLVHGCAWASRSPPPQGAPAACWARTRKEVTGMRTRPREAGGKPF